MSTNAYHHQNKPPCCTEDEQGVWVWLPKKPAPPYTLNTNITNNDIYSDYPLPDRFALPGIPQSFQAPATQCHAPIPASAGSHGLSPIGFSSPLTPNMDVPPFENFETFDINAALQLQAILDEQQPRQTPQELHQQLHNAAALSASFLFDGMLEEDTGFDFNAGFAPEAPSPNGVTPAQAFNSPTSPSFAAFGGNSPSPILTPGLTSSPLSFSSTPGVPLEGFTPPTTTTVATAETLHSCTEPECSRTFARPGDLRKHERKHRQPFRCTVCGKGHLDKRALARHLWAQHPAHAERTNAKSERARCPQCDYEGRQDNVARHIKMRHGAAPAAPR